MKQCLTCGKNHDYNSDYCSNTCYYNRPSKYVTIVCKNCRIEIENTTGRKQFCSQKCYWENRNKMRHNRFDYIICPVCKKEFEKSFGKKNNIYCSRKCMDEDIKGPKHWRWIEEIKHQRSLGIRWRMLRLRVMKRDGNKCQKCGISVKGVDAILHHIKSWRLSPELRFKEQNLITYCRGCHMIVENE